MIVVAVAALLVALVLMLTALSFVRWTLRTIERKDRVIEQLRIDSLDRIAHVAGKPFAPTPHEQQQSDENERDRARRALLTAHIIADPEHTMEYPSPTEAYAARRAAAARFPELDAEAFEAAAETGEPLLVDAGSVNGL